MESYIGLIEILKLIEVNEINKNYEFSIYSGVIGN